MKQISTSEATSPILKLDKKTEAKDKSSLQPEKQVSKNYKFCLYNGNNSQVFRKILLSRGNWEEIKESQTEEKSIFMNANFVWKSYNFSVRKYAIIDDIHRNFVLKQAVNHFENNRGMCTKTGLIRSLSSYYRHLDIAVQAKYSVFDTCATSFVLTAGINDVEFSCFMQRYNEIAKGNFLKEKVPKKHCLENMWLLKPADANQGRGIEIMKTQKEIISSLISKPCNSYWVMQKYVEKPLLYHGRKFDIRIWVLVTKQGEVFIYKPGYIRTCCNEYNMQDNDINLHLTNNFVQKHHQNYGQHEPGNTLPMDCLFDYIDEKFASDNTSGVNLREKIHQRMKDLVIDTILSVKKSMVTIKRYTNFELFGYDFLIDEDLRVWLIEVNTNPYIGVPNDFIKELVPKMAEDLVKIVIDPVFPPAVQPDNQTNEFELIYCENGSTFNNGNPKNVRQPFSASTYPLQKFAQRPNRTQKQYLTSVYNNNPVRSQQFNGEQEDKLADEQEEEQSPTLKNKQRSSSAAKLGYNQSKGFSSPNNSLIEKGFSTPKSLESQNGLASFRSGSAQQSKTSVSTSNDMEIKRKLLKQKTVQEQEQEHDEEDPDLAQVNQYARNENGGNKINNNATYDPDQMYQNLKKLLNTYIYADFKPFYQHVNNILSKMMNWELISEQELKVVVKTLRFILESRISNILVDQKYIEKLIQVIDSQNHPIDLQEVALEALCTVTKSISNKVRIISKNIILLMIRISLTSCDEKEMEKYDKKIRILATNCLVHLGGIYNRRQYIPGETRDNDKIRRIIIENGGLLALLWIRKKVNDPEIKRITQEFIDNLDISDYEMQYKLVKKWRKAASFHNKQEKYTNYDSQQLNISEEQEKLNKEESGSTENLENKPESPLNLQKENNLTKNMAQIVNANATSETTTEFPAFLTKLEYFDLEGSLTTAEDIFITIKESIAKREKEDRLRREIEVKKQQQQEDERKLLILERKAKVEEFQKKKEEEKMKRRQEERKREEKQKELLAQEEKRRLIKFEEMSRKREELRKIQKIEEEKRKGYEENIPKKYSELMRYKRYLAARVALDDTAAKQQLEFINSRNLFFKTKENEQSSMFNSLSNSNSNINTLQNQSTVVNGYAPLKPNNSRSKLASLSNRNISQSPTLKHQNMLISETPQFTRLSMKNQQLRDDNFLKLSKQLSIKSPSNSQHFTSTNFKQRNQRQLSPIKIENHSQTQQQQQPQQQQIQMSQFEIQETIPEQENLEVMNE